MQLEKILLYNAPCGHWNGSKVWPDDFINYEDRTEIKTAHGVIRAWAELYYNRELTKKELRDYELVSEGGNIIKSSELSKRIVDCLSDGYDDEEHRTEMEISLYNELSQINSDSFVKAALLRLCERIKGLV